MAAPINTYELTYIVNAVLSDQQIKEVVARVTRNIQENGGEIIEVDEWGTRRLAYPIRKKRNGYYVNVYFRAPGEAIARLERLLEIDDDILRYLTLRYDAKMLRYYEQSKDASRPIRKPVPIEVPPVRTVDDDEDEDLDEELA
jgi:small subunit ribosomal protein S6